MHSIHISQDSLVTEESEIEGARLEQVIESVQNWCKENQKIVSKAWVELSRSYSSEPKYSVTIGTEEPYHCGFENRLTDLEILIDTENRIFNCYSETAGIYELSTRDTSDLDPYLVYTKGIK